MYFPSAEKAEREFLNHVQSLRVQRSEAALMWTAAQKVQQSIMQHQEM